MRKTGRPAENNFTAKDIRKEPQEDAQVKWRHDAVRTHILHLWPTASEVLPENWGIQPQMGSLDWGVLHWEMSPRVSSFENQRGFCVESQKTMETKSLFQKGGCKISHSVSLSTKAIVLEKAGIRSLLILKSLLKRQGATGTPLGLEMLAAASLGSLFHCVDPAIREPS